MDLSKLPLPERLRLVEDLWDSIAAQQDDLGLSDEQRDELDRRLTQYRTDGDPGRPAKEVLNEIRKQF